MKARKKKRSIASIVVHNKLELTRTYIPELDLNKLGKPLDRAWFINQVVWHDNGSRVR